MEASSILGCFFHDFTRIGRNQELRTRMLRNIERITKSSPLVLDCLAGGPFGGGGCDNVFCLFFFHVRCGADSVDDDLLVLPVAEHGVRHPHRCPGPPAAARLRGQPARHQHPLRRRPFSFHFL